MIVINYDGDVNGDDGDDDRVNDDNVRDDCANGDNNNDGRADSDIDDDGDLEIFSGALNGIVGIDIKEYGNFISQWNMYRGNEKRNGYVVFSNENNCATEMGDVNGDTFINILDLVQISYYILEFSELDFPCAVDVNNDGNVDILDLVNIVNIILD